MSVSGRFSFAQFTGVFLSAMNGVDRNLLPVYFFAVSDLGNVDGVLFIVDFIDDAVIPLSDPKLLAIGEFLAAGRPWGFGECANLIRHPHQVDEEAGSSVLSRLFV